MLIFDKKKIILGLVALVLLTGGIYYIYGVKQQAEVKVPEQTREQNQPASTRANLLTGSQSGEQQPAKPLSELSEAEKERLAAKKVADFFVAMLGSYSTAANFKNIIDLQPLMSQRMREWSEEFIARNRDKSSQAVSVTTKVISSKLWADEGGKIIFLVETMREERGAVERKYNQTAKVGLIKGERGWLVDWLEWQ